MTVGDIVSSENTALLVSLQTYAYFPVARIHPMISLLLDGLNCTWGNWTSYSSCSATCGDGMQYRERSLEGLDIENSRQWCAKQEIDIQTCNIQPCKPGTYFILNLR